MPPKDTEPTGEQINAVKHLLESNVPPYVDFSVYGPFAQRMQKRIKRSPWGAMVCGELQGPASIAVWLSCYHVLMTTLVMLDVVDLGALMKYASHVERLHDRYSESVWGILYQAEMST